jgi:hypothetical protein
MAARSTGKNWVAATLSFSIGSHDLGVGSAAVTDMFGFEQPNAVDGDLIDLPWQAANLRPLRQSGKPANSIFSAYESYENALHGLICPMQSAAWRSI